MFKLYFIIEPTSRGTHGEQFKVIYSTSCLFNPLNLVTIIDEQKIFFLNVLKRLFITKTKIQIFPYCSSRTQWCNLLSLLTARTFLIKLLDYIVGTTTKRRQRLLLPKNKLRSPRSDSAQATLMTICLCVCVLRSTSGFGVKILDNFTFIALIDRQIFFCRLFKLCIFGNGRFWLPSGGKLKIWS